MCFKCGSVMYTSIHFVYCTSAHNVSMLSRMNKEASLLMLTSFSNNTTSTSKEVDIGGGG